MEMDAIEYIKQINTQCGGQTNEMEFDLRLLKMNKIIFMVAHSERVL